jgi:putative integral membrane protein (TIGR02587 family)
LASHFLRDNSDDDDDGNDESDIGDGADARLHPTLADIGGTALGAVFVAIAIAPTDEVPTLASVMSARGLLVVLAASLVISYGIVFAAGFTKQKDRRQQQGILQQPMEETVMSYLVALLASAGMLWFFRRIGQGEPWTVTLSYIIVLGLPAAVGGAAGRLAV